MSRRTVTRADLTEAIYRLNLANRDKDPMEPLSREESAALLEEVLEMMSEALENGDSVKISAFGAFEVREKRARVGRNPKTRVEAPITPRRVLSFRASRLLKERMNPAPAEAAE